MKENISPRQYYTLMFIFIYTNDMVRGYYASELKHDVWIPNLIGVLISLLIYTLYLFIYKNNHYDNFDNSIKHIVGKFVSKIIYILFIIYFIILAFFNIVDILEYTLVNLLPKFSITLLTLLFVSVILYLLIKGLEVVARLSVLLLFGIIVIFISLVILSLSLYDLNLDNILPMLYNGYKTVLRPSLEMGYAVPYGELFVFIIIYENLDKKEKSTKVGHLALISSAFVLISITVLNIFVLGPNAMAFGFSPAFRLARIIDVEEYVQRLDLLLISYHTILVFVKVFVLLYGAGKLLNNIIKLKPKQKNIAYAVMMFIVFLLVFFFYKNYISLLLFRVNYNIKYVVLIMEVFIPLTLVVLSFIRKSKKKIKPKEIVEFAI